MSQIIVGAKYSERLAKQECGKCHAFPLPESMFREDWEKGAFKSEFTITNPNSKSSCGCGESFSI